jgi:serine/threonine-protein kinase
LASLSHPNIAAFYSASEFENQLVMIMEFVDGITLEAESDRHPIGLPQTLDYMCQVLEALSYAHRNGVIHRDIKPCNMMLTPLGVIKLVDFGIAKSALDTNLTMTGTLVGSPKYMSPEQVKGEKVDARTDLYSVGLSLYRFITGVHPFPYENLHLLMSAQIQQAPRPPIQVDPNIPQALNDTVVHALEKDPAKRFQTADEFRRALASIMKSQKAMGASGLIQAQGPIAQPAEASVAPPVPMPTTVIPSSAPDVTPTWLHPPAPLVTRRRLYVAAGALLAVVVILVLAIELFKSVANRRIGPAGGTVNQPANTASRSLAPTLTLSSGDMVLVEGGEALLGKDRHKVTVGAFYIDRTEVTNRQYLMFCDGTGHPKPPGGEMASPDYPVVNITLADARDFAHWANKRLPSADEWEKAARGTDGRIYPWGNDLHFEFANIIWNREAAKAGELASATAYPAGESPYGALNMLGNVWEWVDAPAEVPEGAEFKKYEALFKDLIPPLSPQDPFYEVRGGSYRSAPKDPTVLLWEHLPMPARGSGPDIGFRCAKDVDQ